MGPESMPAATLSQVTGSNPRKKQSWQGDSVDALQQPLFKNKSKGLKGREKQSTTS